MGPRTVRIGVKSAGVGTEHRGGNRAGERTCLPIGGRGPDGITARSHKTHIRIVTVLDQAHLVFTGDYFITDTCRIHVQTSHFQQSPLRYIYRCSSRGPAQLQRVVDYRKSYGGRGFHASVHFVTHREGDTSGSDGRHGYGSPGSCTQAGPAGRKFRRMRPRDGRRNRDCSACSATRSGTLPAGSRCCFCSGRTASPCRPGVLMIRLRRDMKEWPPEGSGDSSYFLCTLSLTFFYRILL